MTLKVNDQSPAVKAMQPELEKVATLMAGTGAMRLAGKKYLPQWPMEDDDSYAFRLSVSTLFNAFARTVENMASKPFSEPLTHTDIDDAVVAWFDNIDLTGRNLQVFAKEVFQLGLRDGLTHILIDFPVTRDDAGNPVHRTRDDEIKAGVRPYMVSIEQKQILGWMSSSVNGAETLTQLRFMESAQVDDGDFAKKDIPQVRVLSPRAWQTYRKSESKETPDKWDLHQEGTTTLDFIPLATFYSRRTGFMAGKPPLLDLADLNIKHWQSSSDQDSILHVARVPILMISGVDDEKTFTVGAKSALVLPVGGEAKYVEHTGAAIEAGRDSLKDLEGQMESMGAELLAEKTVETTATESSIDAKSARCQLAAMVQALEDTLDQAVDVMAKWSGLDEQGDIDIFDDFTSIAVDAAGAESFVGALVSMVESGLLSKETAFAEMQRYGILNPDLVWAEELAKIPVADRNKQLPDPNAVV
jgi:hypothetical protein